MGQALYRKYRSKSLDEVVGQEHIIDTLNKALQQGRISHAYLLTGPRGVGKTSVARILAHAINDLPYADDQAHLDIIEIDAASNNGVEDVRDLREKVYVAPAQAKYKVYIIDEVHMLSKAAFNALLKTLEEPPAHVVFILATTELHKLPLTIISRTQRFVFRPIDPTAATAHLRHIAKQEKIAISDEALELIAQHADGSFRDSIGLLDQMAGSKQTIEASAIRELLGLPSADAVSGLLSSIQAGDVPTLVQTLNGLYDQGLRAGSITKQLSQQVRERIIADTEPADGVLSPILLDRLLAIGVSQQPERLLEIILLEAAMRSTARPVEQAVPIVMATQAAPTTTAAKKPPAAVEKTPLPPQPDSTMIQQVTTASQPKTKQPAVVVPASLASEPPVASETDLNDTSWTAVLNQLKKQYNTLYGIIRMAKPDFSQPGSLGLTFAFSFHQKRMAEAKNQQIISDAVKAVIGHPVTIICNLDPGLKLASKPKTEVLPDVPAPDSDAALTTISNIFGGGELLQS